MFKIFKTIRDAWRMSATDSCVRLLNGFQIERGANPRLELGRGRELFKMYIDGTMKIDFKEHGEEENLKIFRDNVKIFSNKLMSIAFDVLDYDAAAKYQEDIQSIVESIPDEYDNVWDN